MQLYDFTLRYDGALASAGEMDPADLAEVYLGAKRLLAAHCHYYTQGYVPRNTSSSTDLFSIVGRTPERGSVITALTIAILGSVIYDVGKYAFVNHFLPALEAFFERREFTEPPYWRIEPELLGLDAGNHPVFQPDDIERQRLWDRTSQSMGQLTRPIGRSATKLTMYFDGRAIATLDRRIVEYEIEEALRQLRTQQWF